MPKAATAKYPLVLFLDVPSSLMHKERMPVWKPIAQMAWNMAWQRVVGQPTTFILATAATVIAAAITWKLKGKHSAKDLLLDVGIGALAYVVIFAFVLAADMFVVPAHIIAVQEERISQQMTNLSFQESEKSRLSTNYARLQHELDKDQTVLKAVAVILGATNGSFAENVARITKTIDMMQRRMATDEHRLYAAKEHEMFQLDQTNVTIFTQPDHGPWIFFKLKHPPVKDSVDGIVQLPGQNQTPLSFINYTFANVIWLIVANTNGLDRSTFYFTYTVDVENTNLVNSVAVRGGRLCFDGKPQEISRGRR